MEPTITGIHHITAIASDPQRNYDFYTGVLGLRLVKRTVNFDDPGTYHFYYGDSVGNPGTILTFFPWVDAPRGRRGNGQATVTSFSIPESALSYWKTRLEASGIATEINQRFEEEALVFDDPDGLRLELVAHAGAEARPGWPGGPVPREQAIRGFYSVTLSEEGFERTGALLTRNLGFRAVRDEHNRFRYESGAGGPGALVDVLCQPDGMHGMVAAGTVHHVAWRTPDDAQQAAWREAMAALGYNVSPIMDRNYFRSIYFREPGGVLFEIATDPPGFTADESEAELGAAVKLPAWLERQRALIELRLPPLRT